jgi:RsiW-degrading membrane proteinase PrsW (M82 family)
MRARRLLRTGFLNILFLLGFLLLMYIAGSRVLLSGTQTHKLLLLMLLVLIPSLVCVLFYCLQDRKEPEPVRYILSAFLAGMGAASLAVIPLWQLFFRIHAWLYASSTLFMQGTFLVLSPLAAAALYAVIRYIFYPLKEFDEPVDGMIYGAVTGVGLAYVITFYHLVTRPDSTLFVIASVATSQILIYSAVGSLIGYLLGQVKFRRRNLELYGLYALLLGTLLLSVFTIVNDFIFLEAFAGAFFLSFFLGLCYALLVLLYGTLQMRRLTRAAQHQEVAVCPRIDRWPGLLILAVLAAAFLISNHGLKGKRCDLPDQGLHFYYPHAFSAFPFEDVFAPKFIPKEPLHILFSSRGSEELPVSFSVRLQRRLGSEEPFDVNRYVEAAVTESLTTRRTTIAGRKGTRITYSYLVEAQDTGREFPQLIQVYHDVIFLEEGALVFTYRAGAGFFEQGLPLYAKILESVRWDEE